MSKIWNVEELKSIKIGARTANYEALPATILEKEMKKKQPQLFTFEAISIGKDDKGQAFLVPLDESSRETAEYIIRAIIAYEGK